MNFSPLRAALLLILVLVLHSCANIVPPEGGTKDTSPPKLVSVSPPDSQLNTRVSKLSLKFDEFIALSNPAAEINISPILPFPLTAEAGLRTVTLRIPDSLLQDNTTYRITFGKAIQDVHENNPFTGYSYIFSTGGYFDSLELSGYTINAATGMNDTGAMIVLYDARRSDSAVVREKPLYAVRSDAGGSFKFTGLPARPFRIYALHDPNNNLVYDGSGEMVGFSDDIALPGDTMGKPIRLLVFAEADSTGKIPAAAPPGRTSARPVAEMEDPDDETFSYVVLADTSDTQKRTRELNTPLELRFSRRISSFNPGRISLSYDSAGISVEAIVVRKDDTGRKNQLLLQSDWKENTLYTLRLLKGFVKDSAGNDAMPSRHSFRTKRDEDYGKLQVHLPSKYYGNGFIFVLLKDNDTMYHRPVADTMIRFNRLAPGAYTLRVVADRNRNGRWDSGNLLGHIQPEEVIPYMVPINLKSGWENMIDFEEPVRQGVRDNQSPRRREGAR